MKIKNVFTMIGMFILLGALPACEDMDTNYKQYTNEYNYSGKVKNIRTYLGYERVVLAWDNPVDQKSATILIEYDVDKKQKIYDTLVDSVSIEGLNAGTGYDFTVYTVDSAGNHSVPVSLTALPVSKTFVENLTPPSCTITKIDGIPTLKWSNLSTISMRFARKLTYKITGTDGFVQEETVIPPDSLTGTINDYTLPVPELKPGDYHITYTTSVFPISGKTVTIDVVLINGDAKVKL